MNASNYPYNPQARVEDLHGLEKLRAVSDRGLAEELLRLWQGIERAERSGDAARWVLQERARKEREELASLEALGKAAFEGAYGPEGKALAAQMLVDHQTWGSPRRTDARALEAFRDSLRGIRRVK